MTLTNVEPLREKDLVHWTKVTEVHLTNEVMNAIGTTNVQVEVTFVSQNPPYEGDVTRRSLRLLEDQEQEIVFDASYSLSSTMRMMSADGFVTGAFVSDYKRSLYLERLVKYGGVAFENVSAVSVESVSAPATEADGRSSSTPSPVGKASMSVGLIVGVTTGGLIMLIVAIAVFTRRQQRGVPAFVELENDQPNPNTQQLEVASNQSGTIADESLYTRNTLNGRMVPCDGYDNVSSLALSSSFVENESISKLSSAQSFDQNNYWDNI